jgi:hypothetical protein
MKHTPGPWVVDPAVRQGFTVYAPKEGFIVGTQDEEGRYGAIESEANARLISAAPDLLDALLMVLGDPNALDGRPRTYEYARAAIAKATGGKV